MATNFRVFHGDSLEVLKRMVPGSVDAVVTDPPYGLAFMGKKWDYDVPSVELWRQVLRVLKPGGYLLSFGGTRTYHRMVVAIEDAGFDICDMVAWIYGQGFPKSHNISKAIDKANGDERPVVGELRTHDIRGGRMHSMNGQPQIKIPLTEAGEPASAKWDGWGTALKPAIEPICLAQKPIATDTIVGNVLKFGTGAMNIEAARIPGVRPDTTRGAGGVNGKYSNIGAQGRIVDDGMGRWPANVLLGHAETCDEQACDLFECPIALLDQQTGMLKSGANPTRRGVDKDRVALGEFAGQENCEAPRGIDVGGASRFFFQCFPDRGAPWQDQKYSAPAAIVESSSRSLVDDLNSALEAVLNWAAPAGKPLSDLVEPFTADIAMKLRNGVAPNTPLILSTVEKFLHELKLIESSRASHVAGAAIQGLIGTTMTILDRLTFNGYAEAAILSSTPPSLALGARDYAARFKYVAKPSKRERNAGCEDLQTKATHRYGAGLGEGSHPEHPSLDSNHHPTVKPVELIGYLSKLVARKDGVVLDPFMGSGTHGVAALSAGFRFIGIEREAQYVEIARARITAAAREITPA
jgi:DNA modification methylase